ncbi:hypothetical protein BLA39750_05905 [Burkholderia lata]|uniref:Uncharacterized protein n=1 Tax=Burkholderia lata (strain ATCC 17760 / DSM 23089 / LMG 22485 / NCIMB 9086 / R18194 / 383) TaxID=482957 RepID=A0A6P3ATR5_BURL3|nr:hypothetical protein BLA39750_05905 [Burkholderia lata]
MPAALGTRGRAGCECWLKPTDSGKFRRMPAAEEICVPACGTGRADMNGRAILTLQKICRIPVGTREYPARRAVATPSQHCQCAVTTACVARGIAAPFSSLPSCGLPAFRRHVRNAAIPARPDAPRSSTVCPRPPSCMGPRGFPVTHSTDMPNVRAQQWRCLAPGALRDTRLPHGAGRDGLQKPHLTRTYHATPIPSRVPPVL